MQWCFDKGRLGALLFLSYLLTTSRWAFFLQTLGEGLTPGGEPVGGRGQPVAAAPKAQPATGARDWV